jgi:NAD(P)H-hydrate epimerase
VLVHQHALTTAILDPLRELRPAACDKRTFGHVLIVAGSRSMPGAALMATLAALRSGAGLVTSVVPESVAAAFAARAPEAMWVPAPRRPTAASRSKTSPRSARTSNAPPRSSSAPASAANARPRRSSRASLARRLPGRLDADALQPAVIDTLGVKSARPVVITPHLGELARLRGLSTSAPVENAELVDFAMARYVTAILKGPVSRLTDGHSVWHSLFGGPVLARGGSGDILAGLVAGRLATGGEDSPLVRVAKVLAWHGLAADRLARHQGATSAVATDLLAHLAPALAESAHEP